MSSPTIARAGTAELVRKAWSQYIENNLLDVHALRPEVAVSWQRCRNLHIDPFRGPTCEVESLDLKERLYNSQELLKVARPFMENLFSFVKGTGFQVILTDASGVLLEVMGDRDILDRTRRIHLCQGGVWSEAVRGTNAIGTAIAEKRPVQIHAWEHYCEPHHFLTCSASPIFGPGGNMAGALDLSGDYRGVNSHTLGMIVAAAHAIEAQLLLQEATEQLRTANRFSDLLLHCISDGFISVDINGRVTSVNARAAEILDIAPYAVKGQYVGRLPEVGQVILPILAGGGLHENQEVVLHRAGREFSCSASLLRDDSGTIIGAVAVFHEVEHQPVRRMAAPLPHLYTFDEIVSESPRMAAAKQWARIVAPSPFTVLLCGETGTGKELFAQAIHTASSRCNGPFIPINCSAIPEGLIESELFGYDEGAFTGAKKGGLAGKFEAADHGTIFLDEIGDMPLALQTRLLRVIQEGKIVRVGSVKEHDVDVRIIAATHRDLKAEVKRGTFREDLYYRLNGLMVRIPPLRERTEDIPELARRLVFRIAGKSNRKAFEIDDSFIAKLRLHTWPGNVREMENAIEGAILRCNENGSLTAALLDLSSDAVETAGPQPSSPVPVIRENSLRDSERLLISNTLMSFHGNVRKAAAKLGIGRNTLYRKMKAFAIPRAE